MKCKNCGEVNEKGSLFCQECGEPLKPSKPQKKKDNKKSASKKGARVTVRRGKRASETESDRVYRSRLPFMNSPSLVCVLSNIL